MRKIARPVCYERHAIPRAAKRRRGKGFGLVRGISVNGRQLVIKLLIFGPTRPCLATEKEINFCNIDILTRYEYEGRKKIWPKIHGVASSVSNLAQASLDHSN